MPSEKKNARRRVVSWLSAPRRLWSVTASRDRRRSWSFRRLCFLISLALFAAPHIRSGPAAQPQSSEGEGYTVVLDGSMADVLRAVEDVVNDGIVHGTYVYEKEKTLNGAVTADSSAHFGKWQGPGKVFYKVFNGALAPKHFKNSNDIGTITVRYVVQEMKGAKVRVLVDAVFVEDARRTVHASDGSVESSELKEITDHLQQIHLAEQQAEEAIEQRNQQEARAAAESRQREEERARLLAAQSSEQSIEQHVSELRHELVRLVAGPGTELKSAPFHGAISLEGLKPNTEVVVLIVTPYWYGVETPAGHRGWLRRDQVKPIP